jgi:hypothetical protein
MQRVSKEIWSLVPRTVPRWNPFLPALSPPQGWAIQKACAAAPACKVAPTDHSLSWSESWADSFFSGYVFLPSGQVGWGERSCPCKSLYLHLSAVSPWSCVSVPCSNRDVL